MSPAFVDRLAAQLVDALTAAHRVGVLHLDLKPENIVIGKRGQRDEHAVILDFGIGALFGAELSTLNDGASSYQAPELRRGEKLPQSDYYSLGAVLFEVLTRRRYDGERSPDLVPRRWRGSLKRLLDEDPTCRYRTEDELRSMLKRSWWPKVVIAGAAIIFVALVGIYFQRSGREEPYTSIPVPFTALEGEESYPSLSPDGKRVYFSWARSTANADIYVKDVNGTEPVRLTSDPAKETDSSCSPDGRYVAFLRDRALILLPTRGGPETEIAEGIFHSIAWTPDSRSIAVSVADEPDGPKELRLLDVRTRQWRPLLARPAAVRGDYYPSFSPDRRKLAFVREPRTGTAQVFIVNIGADLGPIGEPQSLSPEYPNVRAPQWTKDGKTILYLAGPGSNRALWGIRVDGSQSARRIPEAGDRISGFTLSQSMPRIVYTSSRSDVNIWRLDLDSERRVIQKRPLIASTWHDEEQQISPDGSQLAFISTRSGSEQVWLAGMNGTNQRQLTYFSDTDNLQVFWAPDSRRVLVTGVFAKQSHSFLVTVVGPKVDEIGKGLSEIACGWSRDGKWIYFGSSRPGEPRLWKISPAGGEPLLVASVPAIKAVESFDGKALFYCTRRYSEGVFRVAIGGQEPTRVVPSFARRAFTVGRDGIYCMSATSQSMLRFYAFSDGSDTEVLALDKRPWYGLDVSSDGHIVVFAQTDHDSVDLMLIDGFRL